MRVRPSGLAGSSVSAPSARSRGRGTARYHRRSTFRGLPARRGSPPRGTPAPVLASGPQRSGCSRTAQPASRDPRRQAPRRAALPGQPARTCSGSPRTADPTTVPGRAAEKRRLRPAAPRPLLPGESPGSRHPVGEPTGRWWSSFFRPLLFGLAGRGCHTQPPVLSRTLARTGSWLGSDHGSGSVTQAWRRCRFATLCQGADALSPSCLCRVPTTGGSLLRPAPHWSACLRASRIDASDGDAED